MIIAIDIGLQNLLDKEPVIDILRTASAMKQNRSVLIQTPAQYRFINQVNSSERIILGCFLPMFISLADWQILFVFFPPGTCRCSGRS